jgi:DNA-binding CsgD family transcriptional regulator
MRGPDQASSAAARLVGRELELGVISRLLEQAHELRSGVLVLRGEPGVGKSALLNFAVDSASGMRVLRAVGVEPESELAFAGLHQILRPVFASIDTIPEVQAAALRSALGMAATVPENRFVIALAVLSLLAEVAADGPVLCVVDDAHWLDQPSADALAFVARRLEAEGIVMLFAVREGHPRSFRGAGLPERCVAGLDAAAAERLLAERLDAAVAPEVREAIIEAAAGNPLALLEIPAALTPLQLAGQEALPRPMPIGHDLEAILLDRVRRLPKPAQLLLLVAAADGSGEADVILSAAGNLGIPASSLLDAESSGLIRAEGDTLVLRHPLMRSAIYGGASLPQRQAVHRSLAEVLQGEPNADRRAWHRAAHMLYPDDEIADELERTADRARSRSGHAAACRALRRAAELTSSDDRRSRRLAAAARAAWDAGQPEEASALLRAVEDPADPAVAAELLHLEGEIQFRCGIPLEGAKVLLAGAERIGETNPHLALQMLLDGAWCANYAGHLSLLIATGRTAATLPIKPSDPSAALVDLLVGMAAMLEARDADFRAGLRLTLDRIEDALEPGWLVWASAAAAAIGDHVRDDAFRRRAEAIARTSMAVGTLATVLERIAWGDMTDGQIAAAALHAEEGLRLATDAGLTNSICFHRAILAWVTAIRGDRDRCSAFAEQATDTAMNHGLAPHISVARWALGLLHLGLGEWDQAASLLESVTSVGPGTGHPWVALRALPDLVEAAVRTGRRDVAEGATSRLTAYAREDAPGWAKALAVRCQALTVAEPADRERLLTEALVLHERGQLVFSHARTQLLLGEHLRRERRRKEARIPLHGALGTFEQLGATPWVERAARELRATGQNVGSRQNRSATDLTLQERQIAGMVAEGATNRQIAAQLFLSPRTVEYHLRSVFSKLGISSRVELVRYWLSEGP